MCGFPVGCFELVPEWISGPSQHAQSVPSTPARSFCLHNQDLVCNPLNTAWGAVSTRGIHLFHSTPCATAHASVASSWHALYSLQRAQGHQSVPEQEPAGAAHLR